MKTRLIILALFVTGTVVAQEVSQTYSARISEAHLKDYVYILASDALEGRETGERGQKMAAAFIEYHFDELGLIEPVNGSNLQHFQLYNSYPGTVYLRSGSTQVNNFGGMVYYGSPITRDEETLPVIFAGTAGTADFSKLAVQGKGVLVLLNSGENASSIFARARAAGARVVFVVTTETDEQFDSFSAGFAKSTLSRSRLSLTRPEPNPGEGGIVYLAPSVAGKLFNRNFNELKSLASSAVRPVDVVFNASGFTTIETENVLGYLEGTDKKDELVVITAHYDHVGKLPGDSGDLINNGADDDASGTAAVMELARIFSQAKQEGHGPRRSILFMTVAGEEKGLLGSSYYVSNPVFPLSNTVVNLNIDMIGRRDPQHKDSPPYVYVIGSDKLSSELHSINEAMNERYTKMIFDYTYNDENHPDRLYYRSDHWNFAKNNIPIIFYFDGIHEDYHRPSDEADKIEYDLLTARTRVIFNTAWQVANQEKRLTLDKKTN